MGIGPLESQPMSAPRTGGQILVANLLRQGVDLAFCVPGESYLAVLDALYEARESLRLIVCRHEGGAAYMAEAHGKLTGRPGIAFVTRGPGASNAAIGIHTAAQDSTPMVVFVRQVGLALPEDMLAARAHCADVARVEPVGAAPDAPQIAAARALLMPSRRPL